MLPDKVFKDYVTKYELGKLVELEAEDLNQQSVEFYFTTSGPKDIRVKLNVNGKNVEVETKMEIIKPASTFTAEKGVVRMGMGVGGNGGRWNSFVGFLRRGYPPLRGQIHFVGDHAGGLGGWAFCVRPAHQEQKELYESSQW